MYKISIIIPIYNAKEYMLSCLHSIHMQTLDNLEVILVDDHGEDDSLNIAKQYLAEHPSATSFKFTETPRNSGPGPARNIGIKEATGEYIAFVDSDDWIDPSMMEKLYFAAKSAEADVCYCQASIDSPPKSQITHNPSIVSGNFDGECKSFFLTHYVSYFTTFIYRRGLLLKEDILFPFTRSGEDSYFLTCSLLAAKRIAFVNEPLYHYVLHSNSLSLSTNSDRHKDKIESFSRLLDFAKDRGLYCTYKEELDYIFLKKGYLLAAFNYLINHKHPQTDELKKIYGLLGERVPDYGKNSYYKKEWKLKLLVALLRFAPAFSRKIIPYYIRKTKMMV